MALPKIEEARALSNEALQEEIIATKKELFDLRFQKATRQLEKTHEFKHKKHRLAQLMTVESERDFDSQADELTEEIEESVTQDVISEPSDGGTE